jgi:aspartyl-tRNA synthetase
LWIQVERRPIVIDTNLLLTYVAIRYLDGKDAPEARRDQILTEIRGQSFAETERRHFLLKLSKQRVLTTAHVISEALKLRNTSAFNQEGKEFRRFSLDVLTTESISEIPCPITEICQEEEFRQLIYLYGLADAGLIFVASKSRALVLTDDRRFFSYYSEKPGYVIELLDNYLKEPA